MTNALAQQAQTSRDPLVPTDVLVQRVQRSSKPLTSAIELVPRVRTLVGLLTPTVASFELVHGLAEHIAATNVLARRVQMAAKPPTLATELGLRLQEPVEPVTSMTMTNELARRVQASAILLALMTRCVPATDVLTRR